MSDAQTWTVIGGFFTILVASQALILRLVKAEIGVAIQAGIAPLSERIARLEVKVDNLEGKVDRLDTDVQGIVNRWGRGEV